jgi:hypothetical protein
VMTWLLIDPLILYTRWLLIPLGLLTVPIGASVFALEKDLHHTRFVRYLCRGAILILFAFLLFESRGVVYSARYLASVDGRAAWYASRYEDHGYDMAAWLNTHVEPGQRVALGGYHTGYPYPYFLKSRLLSTSESAEELQWLWEHGDRKPSVSPTSWTADHWRFYISHNFTYVIIPKDRIDDALAAWPSDLLGVQVRVPFVGQNSGVLKIEKDGEIGERSDLARLLGSM